MSEFNFRPPIFGKLDERGRFVPLTMRERLTRMLVDCLWPPKPTARVSAVDVENGIITIERIP